MSGWAVGEQGFTVLDRYVSSGSTDRKATSVTAHATIHTKGSWVELDASTSQDAYAVFVELQNTYQTGTDTSMLVDIGVGASSSEVVLIADIGAGWKGGKFGFWLPIFIPAGTRLAARCQAKITVDTVDVGVQLLGRSDFFSSDYPRYGNCVTYGTVSSTSSGTSVDAGAAAINTKGSWVEIVASTTQPISALGISINYNPSDTSGANLDLLLDIGIGAGGSEEILIPDTMITLSSAELAYINDIPLAATALPRRVPVGTRLSARVQTKATSNDLITLSLHGVT